MMLRCYVKHQITQMEFFLMDIIIRLKTVEKKSQFFTIIRSKAFATDRKTFVKKNSTLYHFYDQRDYKLKKVSKL